MRFTGNECALCGQLLVTWDRNGLRPDYAHCGKGTRTHLEQNGNVLELEVVPVCKCTAENSRQRREAHP